MHLKSTKIDLMFQNNVEESTSTQIRRSTTGGWTVVGEDIDLQSVLRWSNGNLGLLLGLERHVILPHITSESISNFKVSHTGRRRSKIEIFTR